MRIISRLPLRLHGTASSIKAIKESCGVLAPCAISSLNQLNSIRWASDGIRFLDTKSTNIKRGAGGRSSFSGVVATVFGASGFLGRSVCNKLGKTGTQIIIPYRGDHYDVLKLKLAGDLGQVLFYPYHICDEDAIRKCVEYSDVVINLVGRDWDTLNFTMEQANVDTAERLARISKEMGVKKFIHMSALNSNVEHKGFLKDGGSEFLRTKGLSEQVVRDIIPEAVIFRPSDIYGQQDRFFRGFLKYMRFTLPPQTISLPNKGRNIYKMPVFVQDVANGIVKAVFNPDSFGKTYEAFGPKRYELDDLVMWMLRIVRNSPKGDIERMTKIASDDDPIEPTIWNARYDPIIQIKAKLFDRRFTTPIALLTTDRIEREAVTDESIDLPNLRDLGVDLTSLENRIHWELYPYKKNLAYDIGVGEHIPVYPPPAVSV